MRILLLTILIPFSTFLIYPTSAAAAVTKSALTEEVQKLKKTTQQDLEDLEKKQIDVIRSSRNIEGKDQKELAEKKVQNVSEQILYNSKKKGELLSRIDFYDRLLLQIDKYFSNSQDVKSFLEHRCIEMSLNDLGVGTSDSSQNPQMAIFLTQLSAVIRESDAKDLRLIDTIQDFLNQSGILNPTTTAESYLQSKNYTNDKESYKANDIKPEDLEISEEEINHSVKVKEVEKQGAKEELKMENAKSEENIKGYEGGPSVSSMEISVQKIDQKKAKLIENKIKETQDKSEVIN